MPRPTLLALALLIIAVAASAQTTDTWPGPIDKHDAYSAIDVVTLAQPTLRHKCHVSAVTKDAILCRARFAHKPVVYRKNDVAALILPPSHSERYTFIAGVAFTAVCIVSSFFVPAVPVAIGLRIAAGLPPAVLLYLLFFTDKITEDGSDHNDDILLYQKPNVPLQINLRS